MFKLGGQKASKKTPELSLSNIAWPAIILSSKDTILERNGSAEKEFGNRSLRGHSIEEIIPQWQAIKAHALGVENPPKKHDHPSFYMTDQEGHARSFTVVASKLGTESPPLQLLQLIPGSFVPPQNAPPSTATKPRSDDPASSAPNSVETDHAPANHKLECALQLTRTVALDFNNALTSILGHSSLILSKTEPSFPFRRSILEIEKSARRAGQIAHDLASFSKLPSKGIEGASPGINDLLESVVLQAKDRHPSMGWTHDLEPALFDIKGDDSKVRQAIEKIIENAVEATNEQGRVHLETSNQQFHSNYHDFGQLIPAGYYIRVDITDNGVGIPDEDLPNLIKPFFTTKNKDQHQGLGLAWAFGIVTNKGGYLAIDNSRQSATQVRIYLPAKPRSQNQDDDVTTAACNPGGSKRLLVVDDEEIILTLAETVLGSEGHDVVTTTNGMDALQLLEASHTSSNPSFDLLISDLVMPGMSGKVLIERVRRIDPNFRILCTTGFVGSSIEGVVNLPKPFTSRDLIKRVNQVLGV